jgi:hypothetical protein
MNGTTIKIPLLEGLSLRLPQDASDVTVLDNWRVDPDTGAWSSRVGYERFVVGSSTFAPFSTTGPIYSLYATQETAGGGRSSIIYEADGKLCLAYEASGGVQVLTLRSDRHQPSPTECGSWFTEIAGGVVITNGVDRPVLVRPWPLGQDADASAVQALLTRDFGFSASVPPTPRRNTPLADPRDSSRKTGGGATSLWVPSSATGITSAGGGRWGLGFSTGSGKESAFAWACCMISDTGSRGPLTPLANTVWTLNGTHEGMRYGVVLDVPTGPPGTVAREVYRTGNYSDDYTTPGDLTLYFVGLIQNNVEEQFHDVIRTTNLGTPAPQIETGILPSPRARFSAVYASCLWLDGGTDDPRTLFYSAPGAVEQFSPAAYLTLTGPGGGVTALYGSYTSLVVFREAGIDVVQGDAEQGFKATAISHSVSCKAPKSIVTVPGIGVVFLGTEGVFALTGGLVGGSVTQVVDLTKDMGQVIRRITSDCMARACAIYSPSVKEYQLWVPADGSDRPNLGLILHLDGDSPRWSTRSGFPVGSITTLYDGTPVFGHNLGGSGQQAGLFVLSGKRALGSELVGSNPPVMTDTAPPVSKFQSAWLDFGDLQVLKQVQYVTLWLWVTGGRTTGSTTTGPSVRVTYYKDFEVSGTDARPYLAQPPDAAAAPTYGLSVLDSKGTVWQDGRMVPIRVSCNNMACQSFSVGFETQEDVSLIGLDVEFVATGKKVIAGVRS